MRILLVLCLALPAATAQADASDDIAQATSHLRELREEEAVIVLTRAIDRGDATRTELAQLNVLLGVARFRLVDEEGARLAFTRALESDLAAELPGTVPPRTRALFDEIRVQVARRQRDAADAQNATPEVVPEPVETPAETTETPVEDPTSRDTSPRDLSETETDWLAPRRVAGYGVAAAGAVAIVLSAVWNGSAQSLHDEASRQPDALAAQSLQDRAVDRSDLATVTLISGLVAIAAGGALALWPETNEAPARLTANRTGLGLHVVW